MRILPPRQVRAPACRGWTRRPSPCRTAPPPLPPTRRSRSRRPRTRAPRRVDRRHGSRPAAAARPSAAGAVDATQLFFTAPVPSGAPHLAPRVRSASPAARAIPVRERGRRGGAGGPRTAIPLRPRPHGPAPRGLVRGRRGHRLRPPPDHGPAGRRVAGRPRRVELARRNGDPQRPGQDRPKDRSAGLAPSL